MPFRVTVWAQELSSVACDTFAVLSLVHGNNNASPDVKILGQTETLCSNNPDFTKSFWISSSDDDDSLLLLGGQEVYILVSLFQKQQQEGKDDKPPKQLGNNGCAVTFELATVLCRPGNVQAKEINSGSSSRSGSAKAGSAAAAAAAAAGIVGIHIEAMGSAASAPPHQQLCLQLRARNLPNLDRGLGLLNKSDPYFQLSLDRGKTKVDDDDNTLILYRSPTIANNLHPVWPQFYIDVQDLLSLDNAGDYNTNKCRLQIEVWDDDGGRGKDDKIGSVSISLLEILQLAPASKIDEKGAVLMLTDENGQPRGQLIVLQTDLVDATNRSTTSSGEIIDTGFATEALASPTFAEYVAGGCELRVICAVDATAEAAEHSSSSATSTSLYEQALSCLCRAVSKYDSDQKYPVYGFGAVTMMKDGQSESDAEVNHCFSLAGNDVNGNPVLVDGVQGILQAYQTAFLRSSPRRLQFSGQRDFSQVIRAAGRDAKAAMSKERLVYSILLIFTSGDPDNPTLTQTALQEVDDSPLSVVFVSVGKADGGGETINKFPATQHLASRTGGLRDKSQFVVWQNQGDENSQVTQALIQQALRQIPSQLEAYFWQQGIYPIVLPPSDEVAVEPNDDNVKLPLEMDNESGQISLNKSRAFTLPSTTDISGGAKNKKRPSNSKNDQYRFVMNEFRKVKRQVAQIRRHFAQLRRLGNMMQKFGGNTKF